MADIRDLLGVHGVSQRRGRGGRRTGGIRARRAYPKRARIASGEWRLALLVGAALGVWGAPLIEPWIGRVAPGLPGRMSAEAVGEAASVSANFGLCHSGGGWNCVVDGDTFYTEGVKVRVADIDTPETHPSRCAEEARLGEAATLRLQALLNAGPFTLATIDRDEDRYGRKLRVPMRDGESLGDVLVAEGLARPYAGGRRPWC